MISFVNFLLVAAFAYDNVLGLNVNYKDCGSKKGSVVSVDVTPCNNPSLCILQKGKTSTITVKFNTTEEVSKSKAVITGHLSLGTKEFLVKDVCQDLTCPLAKGGSYTYAVSVPVKEYYPPLKVIVEFDIKDQDNDNVVCVMVATKIS